MRLVYLFILCFVTTVANSQYVFNKYYIPPKSYASQYFTSYNNRLFFYAIDNVRGFQLWHFENDRTFFDFNINYTGKPWNVTSMAVMNNKLYFAAEKGLGAELYSYDGIHEPVLVKDIAPGYESSEPVYLNVINNKLYFIAHDNLDDLHGDQIWSHDPVTNTTRQETFVPCGYTVNSSCNFDELTQYNGKLYFRASIDTVIDRLYVFDPQANNTSLVDNLNPYFTFSPWDLETLNNELYFSAITEQYGRELYRYNEKNTLQRISDIVPGKKSGVAYTAFKHWDKKDKCFFKDKIYFIGVDTQIKFTLCAYSANDSKAAQILSVNGDVQYISGISELAVYNNNLFFSASDGLSGDYELWKYDGINPPSLVKDINPGPKSSYPGRFKVWNNSLFFTAYSEANGVELYKMTDTSIKVSLNEHFILYPNPAKNICYIDVGLNVPGSFAILLDDILGRQVYNSGKLGFTSETVTVPIDISSLSSAVYICRVIDGNGKTIFNAKLVKQ